MAEVLITLGIIGIVAALTIPALIDNYMMVLLLHIIMLDGWEIAPDYPW